MRSVVIVCLGRTTANHGVVRILSPSQGRVVVVKNEFCSECGWKSLYTYFTLGGGGGQNTVPFCLNLPPINTIVVLSGDGRDLVQKNYSENMLLGK